MRILALDPSSKATGFAIMQIENEVPYLVRSGTISHPKPSKASFEDKCAYIFNVVKSMLMEWKPDLVVIEYPFVGKNAKTAIQLGRLAGMLEATVKHTGYSYMMVLPTVWKSAFTGNGNAGKELVMQYVNLYYGTQIASNDESDAVAIGHYYLDFYIMQELTP